MQRVLLANDDPEPAAGFHAFQVRCAIDAHQFVRMRRNELIPSGDVAQRTRIDVAIRKADGGMEHGDAGGAQPFEITRRKAGGRGLPGRQLGEVEREQAEHVDDGAAVDQV